MTTRRLVPALFLAFAFVAGCDSATPAAVATPKPKATPNLATPTREELKDRIASSATIFHAGCQDEEKASCKDETRVCKKPIDKAIRAALGKGPVVVEWEAPRETWAKNEGVLDHYWFLKADGSGDYYYLLPSPDDVQTDCGGEYCGWHKETVAAGTLVAAGKFHFVPHKANEIADLDFCPAAPPQPQ